MSVRICDPSLLLYSLILNEVHIFKIIIFPAKDYSFISYNKPFLKAFTFKGKFVHSGAYIVHYGIMHPLYADMEGSYTLNKQLDSQKVLIMQLMN
jgi:hypothetical protein